ncbi:MAG TPA: hypothetical protein VF170_15925 [Planctomycetaceae bacterium]
MPAVEYTIRRKIFTIAGAKFHIYDRDGNLIGYSKQKAFKLKEDIRVYRDESMREELLTIHARGIIDIGAGYDVLDPKTGRRLGVLKRAGLRSIFRDKWSVFDGDENLIGTIEEDSAFLAIVRRLHDFAAAVIPQGFSLKGTNGVEYAQYRTHFNPLVHRLTVTVLEECPLDQAVPLAAGILLVAIEGRQSG